MNRPEGISESAWAAAEQYADELHERDDYMHFESRKVLSRAIQSSVEAENEACAIEAMRWEDGIDAAEHIRRRLRKGA